ncbi:carbohydrate-binding protein [Streptomyces sp. SID486]|uniref:carbohydrate-binding protein n=1 Tax=Streptomyces sp. SID486 TaxID=2690264 RepID=UPI001368F888|nr:carbohydrate-binding protein [Streptomyces sp. SID486]MYX94075.1 carbohydrate-binding protein [Streptomyces sp. SID486]
MTPGNNGASTPEDDDPFGYLYADGQARGAQPPSGGGYGYPNSVSRVRAVGERQYGQQQAPYGQPPQAAYGQTVPQQAPYGQPNAHYQAPETLPGGAASGVRAPQPAPPRRGPNTKGLLIGAVAVVAAVVIGIGMAMLNGNTDDGAGNEANSTPSQSQSDKPSPSGSKSAPAGELPKTDAKDLTLGPGVTTATDVKGARASGGSYVTGFNQTGASVTWTVDNIPESGKYSVYIGYSVPGKDGTATLTVNNKPSDRAVDLKNWRGAAAGDYENSWTKTYNYILLDKGTNTIKVSCEQGNQCDTLIDQMWLVKGWVGSKG